jgi:hypothetical protein
VFFNFGFTFAHMGFFFCISIFFKKKNHSVILAAYLKQLQNIRLAMAQENIEGTLNDFDRNDLVRENFDATVAMPTSTKQPLTKIRVATVDNYQGEEADVVIASLVRGNKERSIGFLSTCERVNVLLSRARCGMIMLCNRQTLENSKNREGRTLWNKIFTLADKEGHTFSYLPISCKRHNSAPSELLDTAVKIKQYCPDGGCSLPCIEQFSCAPKHPCPKNFNPW